MDTRYDELARKAIGWAFIIGPALLTLAALVNAAGIGRNPYYDDSYVEGNIGFYAFLLFIPIWVTLAGVVGRRYPRFGIVLAAWGMLSAAAGVIPMAARAIQKSLTDTGIEVDVWTLLETGSTAALVLFPATFGLVGAAIGIGLLMSRTIERHVGILLIIAMPLMYLAQAFALAVLVTWTAMAVVYLVALAPLGWRMLTTGSLYPAGTAAEAVAPA